MQGLLLYCQLYLNINLACLSVCPLYPINVKTAEPIGTKRTCSQFKYKMGAKHPKSLVNQIQGLLHPRLCTEMEESMVMTS